MRQHRHIGLVVEQVAHRGERVADAHRDIEARKALVEGHQHVGDVVRADRADAQVAGAQVAALVEEVERLRLLAEHPPRDLEQAAPGLGQLDAAAAAQEQLDGETLLEGTHLGVVMVGWLTRQRCAAAVKLPLSATA